MATPAAVQPAPASRKMSYEEFLAWCDEDTWAEWVDGAVVIMSPVSFFHQDLADFLVAVLRIFIETLDLGWVCSAPFQMRLASLGVPIGVGDLVGLHYIAHLLRNPFREVDAADLETVLSRWPADPDTKIHGKVVRGPLGNAGKVIDPQTVRALTARRKELEELLAELKENPIGSPEEALEMREEVKEEIEQIDDYLRKAKGPGGVRIDLDLNKRVRDRVTKAIKRSLEAIEEAANKEAANKRTFEKECLRELSDHLSKALDPIRSPFRYKPDRPINWIL